MTKTAQPELVPDTKTPTKTKDVGDETVLVDGTPDERDDAARRAQECSAVIQQTLETFHCVIQPYVLPPEPVGVAGDRIIVAASYGIRPIPLK